MSDDLAVIARDLRLPQDKVEETIKLLDAGNTIPFIARFRKDQVGGLDPEQLSAIKQRVGQLRALAERKSFVLKSIESQGQLTETLAAEINQAGSSRRVEDLYLPFKAKKQSLAITARQQGLEPLVEEIIAGMKTQSELAAIALEYVRVDRGLANVDDVMSGVGHLIAERFSERSDVRRELRRMIWTAGSLHCKSAKHTDGAQTPEKPDQSTGSSDETSNPQLVQDSPGDESAAAQLLNVEGEASTIEQPLPKNEEFGQVETAASSVTSEPAADDIPADDRPADETTADVAAEAAGDAAGVESIAAESVSTSIESSEAVNQQPSSISTPPKAEGKKREANSNAKKPPANPFADYEDFTESLRRIPNHRVLAINRGERAGLLKAKVKADSAALESKVIEMVVSPEHPFREFLIQSAQDALARLIFPSLEREVRRELTEAAEQHALKVFSENLKSLLLQQPIRGKRILAIDPGYKSGCAVAVLDEQGAVLHTDRIFVVGNQTRRAENRAKLSGLVNNHQVDVIAIGNGTACREVEQIVSDAIKMDLANRPPKYVIVNEAGTSTYSTSEIGKEELPNLPAGARCAVSIGRRLLDPLSELVKIPPANLGVGLYQHDIKAKHLAESLDDVVEACVNHVGVNVNTASTSLLRHVAGLNQLTARRLVEARQQRPFSNRQQLKEVTGIGDSTFVQAAGFLRIYGGDEPLDETPIHPESYPLVEKILGKVGMTAAEWFSLRKNAEENRLADSTPRPNADANAENDTATENAADVVAAENAVAASETKAPSPSEPSGSSRGEARIPNPLADLKEAELAIELQVGELLMRDLLESLQRPTHDPRSKNLGPVFRTGIIKLEDLQPEMRLDSQIVNVVDFGVFVDVGLGYSCLVHVSELSRGFVRDLHQQFAVGDVLTTWVKEIDLARRRVKLTAIPPGAKKFERRGRRKKFDANEQTPRDRVANRDSASTKSDSDPAAIAKTRARSAGPRQDRPPPRSPQAFRGKKRHASGFPRRPRIEFPSKPKPVKPITDEMLSGSKPMRSFSDLAQFYEKKTPPKDE